VLSCVLAVAGCIVVEEHPHHAPPPPPDPPPPPTVVVDQPAPPPPVVVDTPPPPPPVVIVDQPPPPAPPPVVIVQQQPAPPPVVVVQQDPGAGGNKGRLTKMGHLDQYLPPNFQGECFLKPGIYTLRNGSITFNKGNLTIRGSGKQNTYIEGDMKVEGNQYNFTDFTLKGNLYYRGNSSGGDISVTGHMDKKGFSNTGSFMPK
jgi:hypothetical protein